jgi:hypothetical protein
MHILRALVFDLVAELLIRCYYFTETWITPLTDWVIIRVGGGNIAHTTAATLENLMMTALDTTAGTCCESVCVLVTISVSSECRIGFVVDGYHFPTADLFLISGAGTLGGTLAATLGATLGGGIQYIVPCYLVF